MQLKNKEEAKLRLNMKNFEDVVLLHELFVTTKQSLKIRNVFANNI